MPKDSPKYNADNYLAGFIMLGPEERKTIKEKIKEKKQKKLKFFYCVFVEPLVLLHNRPISKKYFLFI